ncbi:ABC transporter permease [Treponema sp.]|uniref:ABC transporter permease n=1 Tax=Treponema sp. TaxID=166 RepID=UPI0025F248C6|nr:ABC transporter permease [Treponema sp.]MCR5218398.1 ABC transporter permease [Treponema sp.]
MLEDFINAFANFKRNKIRTILSLLGIIIGVASVIVIMSMGTSSTQQIQDTFGSNGLDMVSVSSGFKRKKREAISLLFNESFRQDLFNRVENIKKVWYKNTCSMTLSYGDTSVSITGTAVETDYLQEYGLKLSAGDYFTVTDNVMGTQKIILGSEIATSLFPNGDAVGKVVNVVVSKVSFSFTVCGVMKEQTSGMENTTSGAYITRGFYSKKIKANPDAATIMVQAVSKEKTTELVTTITEYCEEVSGTEGSVNVTSMQTIIDQISSITNTMSIMLSAIAAISLLVGGIGIMNIMIVTVTERRQEIGIRKALGASPAVIRQQFLIESASITLMGGTIGIIIGILVSLAVEFVRSLSFVISWQSCIIAFVFSVFVGIFFGLSPASRAAKLDPVAALA